MIPAIAISAVAVFASGVFAQTTPAPAFEVASVKPNKSGCGNSSMDYSLSGPDWLDSECFDVIAKPPAGTPPQQFNPMLQDAAGRAVQAGFSPRIEDAPGLSPDRR